jgi:hypothetical protein
MTKKEELEPQWIFASAIVSRLLAGATAARNVTRAGIRGFFDSPAISRRFVRRVLEEYGQESVKAAFLLRGDLPGYWLDWLLRSRKGRSCQKRYPTLSVARPETGLRPIFPTWEEAVPDCRADFASGRLRVPWPGADFALQSASGARPGAELCASAEVA